jgi:hypothetical protein
METGDRGDAGQPRGKRVKRGRVVGDNHVSSHYPTTYIIDQVPLLPFQKE